MPIWNGQNNYWDQESSYNKQTMKDRINRLIREYQNNPCRLHACALWKTLKNIEEYDLVVSDKVIRISNETMVHLDYYPDNPSSLSYSDLTNLHLLILHQDQLNNAPKDEFETHEKYFRLKYNGKHSKEIHHHFIINTVDVETELEAVSEFISKCYEDLHPSPEYFLRCTQEAVFDHRLWIWIIDPATEKKVGLGIAEYDPITGEGSLDWIQVLPSEHGKGIGSIIVNELVRRLNTQAKFITVAGKSKIAEKLYRKCGFTGENVWHVFTK